MNRDNYYTNEQLQEMIQKFESLLLSVDRPGMEELIAFIRKSDFYTAPASTRFHNAVRGGLLAHSLNVYECLQQKMAANEMLPIKLWEPMPSDSIILTALLHDVCKTYYYSETSKNVKHYEPEIVAEEVQKGAYAKTDSMGQYVWVTERGYEVDDKIPFGHGEKSVMMVEKYIELKGYERYMIRWHMGFSVPKEEWGTFAHAMDLYPWVLAIFEADMEASYRLDVRD